MKTTRDLQGSCVSPGKKKKQKAHRDRTHPGVLRSGDWASRAPQSLLTEYLEWSYVYYNHSLPEGGTEDYPDNVKTNFQDLRGAAFLLNKNRTEITVLMCEQNPLSNLVFVPLQELYGTSVDHHSLNWLRR